MPPRKIPADTLVHICLYVCTYVSMYLCMYVCTHQVTEYSTYYVLDKSTAPMAIYLTDLTKRVRFQKVCKCQLHKVEGNAVRKRRRQEL